MSLVVRLWVLSLTHHGALQPGEVECGKFDCTFPMPHQACIVGNHQNITCGGKEQSEAPDSQSWLEVRGVPGPSKRQGLWSSQGRAENKVGAQELVLVLGQ